MDEFDEVLRLEPAHQGARIHKAWKPEFSGRP
jgi:hypothetical protein